MKFIIFVFVVLLSGCTSRQLAIRAVDISFPVSSHGIRFSYEVKNEFSTEYFGMFGFVIENTSHQWMTVDSIEISGVRGEEENMVITGGSDLSVWFSSMNKEKQIESLNRQRLWGTISSITSLGAVVSKDNNTRLTAALAAAGSTTMLTIERYNAVRGMLDLSDYFPEDHILRTPFRIPPGLGVDKWMVINSQVVSKDILATRATIRIYYNGGSSKEYVIECFPKIPNNNYVGTSYSGVWQKKLFSQQFGKKTK